MDIKTYIDLFTRKEAELREMHGELAYYGKLAVHGQGDEIIPVASWAEYLGMPLILPSPDYVDFIAITTITDEGRAKVILKYLQNVVEILKIFSPVNVHDKPLPHLSVMISEDEKIIESLRMHIENLLGIQNN